MIAMLTGRCSSIDGTSIVIETAGGVGYLVRCTNGVIARANQSPDNITVFIHTVVREDSITLYGFAEAIERDLVEVLLSLQGVGPKVALTMISVCGVQGICSAVSLGDHLPLQAVPGIGPKLAKRIASELAENSRFVSWTQSFSAVASASAGSANSYSAIPVNSPDIELRNALMALGMNYGEAELAARSTDPEAAVEQRIRQALGAGASKVGQ